MAYCLRFLFNSKNPKNKKLGVLTIKEINESFNVLLRISQEQSFPQEIRDLKKNNCVNNSSSILNLRPFIDSNFIIRVGGRIAKARLPYNKKHPIILHKKHPLTSLIIINEHKMLLHCGPQQLLYAVRENFWPLSGRDLTRKVVHNCITCFRAKPKACESIMGELPSERINQCFPFTNVGCDYAGPVYVKDRKTRKPILSKGWISIFVCMATKAIHIDLVTDLSTQSFIACLKRFIARRGKPSIIFSDNGSQYIGANAELLKFIQTNKETISKYFNSEGITWKFIPPRAPNFGGLWEGGVKSLKYHLKRVMGNYHLHFDDFCTLLCQIEAVLNSRPLSPLSSSPDDYVPLTPAHFLIGRPFTSLPEPNYICIPENRLKLHQNLQRIIQIFWKRWNKEYIGELQTRLKWSKNYKQLLQIGSLVIVKDDNAPPLQWRMARVMQLHPGDDQIVRVVTVRFSDGSVLKRSVRKLCLVPFQDLQDQPCES
ncbi:uncharacterized protein LOC111691675 [Anoplophora glabripennis]|uniref:uncharacterized protein LOC111691675 n=1 Tax=Anoplophora glabripennis TaxID=217634 RepID=UPI000C765ADE|nr:uncharacterized protein LOC111691675 [Anoplophora glabripennis]